MKINRRKEGMPYSFSDNDVVPVWIQDGRSCSDSSGPAAYITLLNFLATVQLNRANRISILMLFSRSTKIDSISSRVRISRAKPVCVGRIKLVSHSTDAVQLRSGFRPVFFTSRLSV